MTPLPTLSTPGWRDQLAELALACAAAGRADGAELVQRALDLLGTAPPALRGLRVEAGAARRVAALLAGDAADAAALALLEGRAGYLLSRGTTGPHMATVVVDGADGEASGEGDSAALALVGALAALLAGTALRTGHGNHAGPARAGLRLN